MFVCFAAALGLVAAQDHRADREPQDRPGDRWVAALGADDPSKRTEAHARFARTFLHFGDAAFILHWTRTYGRHDARRRAVEILKTFRPRLRRLVSREKTAAQLRQLAELDLETPIPPIPLVGNAGASLDSEDAKTLDKLRAIRISVDMEDAPLTAVIDYFQEISGLNMCIDPPSVTDPDGIIVTFKKENALLGQALAEILLPHRLAYVVEGDIVAITSCGAIRRTFTLELYDVQDIISEFPDLVNGDAGPVEKGETDLQPGERLMALVRRRVHPGEWEAKEGRSLSIQNGLLIVRNMKAVHGDLLLFLQHLRAGKVKTFTALAVRNVTDSFDTLDHPDAEERRRTEARIRRTVDAGLRAIELLEKARTAQDPEIRARAWSLLSGP